jgi:hypothetical protein
MKKLKAKIAFAFVLCLLLAGCALHLYPPAFDLAPLRRVGLATFSLENAEGPLADMAAQHFMEEIFHWQRVEIVELGSWEEALRSVGADRTDQAALLAIGQRYGVAAVFTGRLRASDIKPSVDILSLARYLSVRATFNIFLTATLTATDTGGVLWTDSAERRGEAGRIGVGPGGIFDFSLRDQEENYRRLVHSLVYDITRDFRPR